MKAAFITGHGGNEVVQVGAYRLPERAPGEVRVRVQAATLNQVDLYMRSSGAGITHRLPRFRHDAGMIVEHSRHGRRRDPSSFRYVFNGCHDD